MGNYRFFFKFVILFCILVFNIAEDSIFSLFNLIRI